MPEQATCRSCGAPITWVRTERGNLMPVNAGPDPGGNVVLEGGLAVVLSPLEAAAREGTKYRAHWADCPHAARHRRKKS